MPAGGMSVGGTFTGAGGIGGVGEGGPPGCGIGGLLSLMRDPSLGCLLVSSLSPVGSLFCRLGDTSHWGRIPT
jgi:hypothetical protein